MGGGKQEGSIDEGRGSKRAHKWEDSKRGAEMEGRTARGSTDGGRGARGGTDRGVPAKGEHRRSLGPTKYV